MIDTKLKVLKYRYKILTILEKSVSEINFLISKTRTQSKDEMVIIRKAWSIEIDELNKRRIDLLNNIIDMRKSITNDDYFSKEDYLIKDKEEVAKVIGRINLPVEGSILNDGHSDEEMEYFNMSSNFTDNRIELKFLKYRYKIWAILENKVSDINFLIPKTRTQSRQEMLSIKNAWSIEMEKFKKRRIALLKAIVENRFDLDGSDMTAEEIFEYEQSIQPCIHPGLDDERDADDGTIERFNSMWDNEMSDEDLVMKRIAEGDGDLMGY